MKTTLSFTSEVICTRQPYFLTLFVSRFFAFSKARSEWRSGQFLSHQAFKQSQKMFVCAPVETCLFIESGVGCVRTHFTPAVRHHWQVCRYGFMSRPT